MELDTSTHPRQIDLKFDAGPEKGNTNRGIYELGGDTWKICPATRGWARPSRFASKPGSGFVVETLTRGKLAAPTSTKPRARAKDTPATEFEGAWRMISGTFDGKPMEASLVKWVRRVTRGNQTTVFASLQVMLKVEFTSDGSKMPKTVDYLNIAGANRGKTQYGIYELKGKQLTVCMAPPGGRRPTTLQSSAGEGGALTVWERE